MTLVLVLLLAVFAASACGTPTGRYVVGSATDHHVQETLLLDKIPFKNSTSIEIAQRMLSECTAIDQCSFIEKFERKDKKRWEFANNYANGDLFAAWWSQKRVLFDRRKQKMLLSVGRKTRYGKSFVSGQTQSKQWHGYGCYEVRMKPANQEGLITTFFTYTGKYDAAPGMPKKHNEIDVEFVYKRRYKKVMLQANYFTNGRGGHERIVKLPFDVVDRMHNYAFKWTRKRITWYVDGKAVFSTKKDTPRIGQGPHKIMMSLWPVSEAASGWGGNFNWRGSKKAVYAATRFTKGEDCKIYNRFW